MRTFIHSPIVLAAILIMPFCVHAKINPQGAAGVLIPQPGSVTPPPKEWAMFPIDEPPAPPPQQPQTPTTNSSATASQSGKTELAPNTTTSSSGVVSAPNPNIAPKRELPLIWLIVTALLSLGTIAATASLIFRNEFIQTLVPVALDDEIPVVDDTQEVTGATAS